MNRSNVFTGTFPRVRLSSLLLNVLLLCTSCPIVYGQTISWSGYSAGASSYNSGPMSATISNSPGNYYINSSPKYHATTNSDIHPPNNNCGAVGLLMEMDWGNNANTQNYATTLTINFAQCVYGPVTFSIFDINTDNYNDWGDWIDISAMGPSGALSAPSVSGCTPNSSVVGNTRRLKGGIASSANTTGCTCGTTNVSVGNSSNRVTGITLKYYADPGAWATSPNNPAFQYIIVSNITVGNIVSCTLPVELLGFNGRCTNGKKWFQWSTASESNNDYFVIEHSKDGIVFIPAATDVAGAGTSNLHHDYEQEVAEQEDVFSYYRLKQVDKDGNIHYSGIIEVNCRGTESTDFNIVSEHASANIKVVMTHEPESAYYYEIYDMLGKRINNGTLSGIENYIPMQHCQKGMYFLKLWNEQSVLPSAPKSFLYLGY